MSHFVVQKKLKHIVNQLQFNKIYQKTKKLSHNTIAYFFKTSKRITDLGENTRPAMKRLTWVGEIIFLFVNSELAGKEP